MFDLDFSLFELTPEEQAPEVASEKCQLVEIAQYRYIEWCAAQDLPYYDLDTFSVVKRPPLAKLARELGYSRQALYKWRETIPDFQKQVDNARRGLMETNISAVWNALFLQAMDGNIKAIEMYLAAFDPSFVPLKYKAKYHKPEPQASWVDLLRATHQDQATS